MDLLLEKKIFLKRFEQITDIELINALNSLLDFALPRQNKSLSEEEDKLPDNYELSEEHKQILDERLLSYQKNPENVISWEDVKKRIKRREKKEI
jgi:putative addiction module component (TIGR02574 family)